MSKFTNKDINIGKIKIGKVYYIWGNHYDTILKGELKQIELSPNHTNNGFHCSFKLYILHRYNLPLIKNSSSEIQRRQHLLATGGSYDCSSTLYSSLASLLFNLE